MKIYQKYKAIDFLKDESFLNSILLSSREDILFWEDFILKNPEKKKDIERAKQILLSVAFNRETFTGDEKIEMLGQINKSIHAIRQRKYHLNIYRWMAAACIAGIVSAGYIFFSNQDSTKQLVAEQETNAKAPIEKNTQLILADQKTIVFDDDADITYQKGGKVISSTNKEVVELNLDKNRKKYNKLIVPKGKRASFLVLEDGSKVWVNSGSTLEFPVSFAGDKREIIVDGEIYIEVKKDAQRPFYVRTSEMNVKVLGTRFNVSAYKEDTGQSVVLVEGLVEVQSKDESKKKILLPDHKLTVTKDAMDITKADTYDYISWKDGLLQFKSQPLSAILAKLSRYYDMEIDCEPDIKTMKCTGKLVLFDNLPDVLETISCTIPLEKTISNNVPVTYKITDKYVYIKKK